MLEWTMLVWGSWFVAGAVVGGFAIAFYHLYRRWKKLTGRE